MTQRKNMFLVRTPSKLPINTRLTKINSRLLKNKLLSKKCTSTKLHLRIRTTFMNNHCKKTLPKTIKIRKICLTMKTNTSLNSKSRLKHTGNRSSKLMIKISINSITRKRINKSIRKKFTSQKLSSMKMIMFSKSSNKKSMKTLFLKMMRLPHMRYQNPLMQKKNSRKRYREPNKTCSSKSSNTNQRMSWFRRLRKRL